MMKSIRLLEMLEEADYSRREFLDAVTMALASAARPPEPAVVALPPLPVISMVVKPEPHPEMLKGILNGLI